MTFPVGQNLLWYSCHASQQALGQSKTLYASAKACYQCALENERLQHGGFSGHVSVCFDDNPSNQVWVKEKNVCTFWTRMALGSTGLAEKGRWPYIPKRFCRGTAGTWAAIFIVIAMWVYSWIIVFKLGTFNSLVVWTFCCNLEEERRGRHCFGGHSGVMPRDCPSKAPSCGLGLLFFGTKNEPRATLWNTAKKVEGPFILPQCVGSALVLIFLSPIELH